MTARLALVTGASAGIGAVMARQLAVQGHDLVLVARRLDRLESLARELAVANGLNCEVIACDLAQPGAADLILAKLDGRAVDVLVNNAGYGLPGHYATTSWQDQSAFIQVMVTAVCELSHRLLPTMIQRGYGRILNVSSLAGLLPGGAGHTLYGASKAFLVTFSQSLNLETQGTGVHVTALCPGFTRSEFHDANGSRDRIDKAIPPLLWQTAEDVARAGLAAVEANQPVCVPGLHNKIIAGIAGVLPQSLLMAASRWHGSRIR